MVSRENSIPKLEYPNGVNSFFPEEQTPLGIWDYGYPDHHEGDNFGILGLEEVEPYSLAHPINHNSNFQIKLNDFQDFSSDLASWDFDFDFVSNTFNLSNYNNFDQLESKDHDHMISYENMDKKVESRSCSNLVASEDAPDPTAENEVAKVVTHGRYKSSTLELDDIQKYFDIPITRAAKELNVGLTVLKKRCRELNIMRWPHRKIKSLKSLIHNVKELGLSDHEIELLENHKRMIQEVPEMELTDRTKKLRQACFKASYKKRRALHQSALL
ncbi:uncharacterized protein [Henckelia pumila]|uniref:uncharacterized protein n=1 Tax=Henckelia pumila TaxID=405737 RepID=UPI003C6E573C